MTAVLTCAAAASAATGAGSLASAAMAGRSPHAAAVAARPSGVNGSLSIIGDTLVAPFTVGMGIAEIDTLASTLRMRWLGREIRDAGDSALSLFELRDTTVRGVLIYSLTLDRGRLRQVEIHRNVAPQDRDAFGRWLGGIIRALGASSEPSSFNALVRTFCREGTDGVAITTRLLLRDGDHATIVACAGTPCAAFQRP